MHWKKEFNKLVTNNADDKYRVLMYATKNCVNCWTCVSKRKAERSAYLLLKNHIPKRNWYKIIKI